MDQYSFLNTAHTAYFAELYDQYLINPELVEPRNMGAWSHLLLHLEEARSFKAASRWFYGSPAAGSSASLIKDIKK